MKRYIAFLLLISINAWSSSNSPNLSSYDIAYLNEKINAYTETISSRDNIGKIPRGLLLQNAYMHQLMEDEIIKQIESSPPNDKVWVKSFDFPSSAYVSERSQIVISQLCEEVNEQKRIGHYNANVLAQLAEQAEQAEYQDMEKFYTKKITKYPEFSAANINNKIAENARSISFSRVDWSGLAIEVPDLVYVLLERGCSNI